MLICFIVFDYMVLENSVLHFHFVGFGVVCVCTLVLSLNEVYSSMLYHTAVVQGREPMARQAATSTFFPRLPPFYWK